MKFDDDASALLARYGFDRAAFERLKNELAGGRFERSANRVRGSVAPPEDRDLLPHARARGEEGRRQLVEAEARIGRGQLAVAVLNGGMATRFGGRVKGVVPAVGEASFLELKLRQVHRRAPRAHIFLMNSFATWEATGAHLEARGHFGLPPEQVHQVAQGISVRLTPGGDVFVGADGRPSFYAPGHGDLLAALAGDPAFAALAARHDPLHVMVSNVDNLGATVEPWVLGAHLLGGRALTCEVAERRAGDAGGAPVRLDGHLEVLEEFRFPTDFDPARCSVFNTNTFLLDAPAIRARHPLTWFRADKQVDGRPAVQFERLLGELTHFVDATYLSVPRDGSESRFLPVKAPADLDGLGERLGGRLGPG